MQVESTLLLECQVPLEQHADKIVAEAVRLALLTVTLERLDDGRRQPIPRAGVLDQVVDDLVQRLPTRLFHPLLEPASGLKRQASADAGELDCSRSTCHVCSLLAPEPKMKHRWK